MVFGTNIRHTMKKYINTLTLIICSIALFSGCQKDNDYITFRAETSNFWGGNQKVILDANNYACWQTGDRLRINNETTKLGGGIYEVNVDANGNATISDVKSNGAGYRAIYPSTIGTVSANAYYTVTLPTTQTYNDRVIPTPMVAHAANTTQALTFRHICALMKVRVTGVCNVTSIKVSATVPIAGTGSVQGTDEAPYLVMNSGQPTSVTLDCGSGVSVNGYKDFYVIIPPISDPSNKFTITLTGEGVMSDGTLASTFTRTQTTGGSTIARSQMGSVTFDLAVAEGSGSTGMLCGEFSVSSRQKVHFSKGNLRYNSSSNTWSFADNQWDYLGAANKNGNSLATTIDLFGWGTGNNPTLISNEGTNYGPGENSISGVYDWGHNSISNGGNTADYWRTLSQSEWSYIISQRANANQLHGLGKVNGVKGLILLPDNWTYTALNSPNADNYTSNSYTSTQWQDMQYHGAVFLPAAGYRGTTSDGVGGVYRCNEGGGYWATNFRGKYAAWALTFYNHGIEIDSYSYFLGTSGNRGENYRKQGMSVRLVH